MQPKLPGRTTQSAPAPLIIPISIADCKNRGWAVLPGHLPSQGYTGDARPRHRGVFRARAQLTHTVCRPAWTRQLLSP